MPNALKKIIAVFVIIGLLPISYVSYELLTINETEEMLSEVYQRQLDAILFSVNQYSTDMVNSWANQLNSSLLLNDPSGNTDSVSLQSFYSKVASVQAVYLWSKERESMLLIKDTTSLLSKAQLDQVISENPKVVKKMIHYKAAGYQKMEVMDSTKLGGLDPILFALDTSIQRYQICILVIDPVNLIQSELGPKMQAIGGDQFDLSAIRKDNGEVVYSTQEAEILSVKDSLSQNESWQQKEFWLLPDYYLSISQKGKTIHQLVKERSNNNLIVLGIILIISIGGMGFLFQNIRRELYLSNAKSEFVSNVSHEIRTPLALISMFAETLEMGRVNKEEKKLEYYSIIKKETFRLTKIVNSILSFSKLDANKRTYQFEELDLNDLCKEILLSYSHHLADNKFNYDVEFKEGISSIHGDREAVSETIINLIDNAMKYSDDKKEVVLRTGEDRNSVFVEVQDFGMGIPNKYQSDIFEQFFRTPSNNVHNTKGSGLGLAIVKRIMIAHNGTVTVESTIDEGSTFKLSFPNQKTVES